MITKELISFIKAELALGKNKEQINAELLAGGGWKSDDLDEAFLSLNKPIISTPNVLVQSKPKKTNKIFAIVLIVLFLFGVSASAYFFKDEILSIPFVSNLINQGKVETPLGESVDIQKESVPEEYEQGTSIKIDEEVVLENLENTLNTPVAPEPVNEIPIVKLEEIKPKVVVPSKPKEVVNKIVPDSPPKNTDLVAEESDLTDMVFTYPPHNTKVKIGEIVTLKIRTGKDVAKIKISSSVLNWSQFLELSNGLAEFSFEVPESLKHISFDLIGWNKSDQIILGFDENKDFVSFLTLIPYTNYKVIDFHTVPDVIEAFYWESNILNEDLHAEFENNALGGLIEIPSSDIEYRIEDESIIKLTGYGRMQGVKSGETYIHISYKGVTKKIPIYFQ